MFEQAAQQGTAAAAERQAGGVSLPIEMANKNWAGTIDSVSATSLLNYSCV